MTSASPTIHRLDAGPSTLLLTVDAQGPTLLYLGARLQDATPLEHLTRLCEPITPHGELDVDISVPHYPADTGVPGRRAALRVNRLGRARFVDLMLRDIVVGESSLIFTLQDSDLGIGLELVVRGCSSGIFEQIVTLENTGGSELDIAGFCALHLSVPQRQRELLRVGGFWANEFQASREIVGASTLCVESLRGRSSHSSSPALLLGEPGFSNEQGTVWSAALCWSGNHRISISPSSDGSLQLLAEVPLRAGELRVSPGESVSTPLALFTASSAGMNGLRTQHQAYWNAHSAPQETGHIKTRLPVHFNSWEATYFDHNERSSCALITEAALLGAERFVLDDGWMANREQAGRGLGDWLPCPKRYPRGLKPVADCARAEGLGFGLWIEPEMATGDSQMAVAHPQWLIARKGRQSITGRGQYLLNLGLKAVRDYLLGRISALIDECDPDYLKWDMNRDHAEVGVDSGSSELAMQRGFDDLLSSLVEQHPQITIEICSAGGARADCGAMRYAHRLWPSDSMDPVQRFAVLRNASLWLPMARLGSHVGSSHSSTSGRTTPLSTRCAVAMMGHFGLELDTTTLPLDQRELLCKWVERFKRHREWLWQAERHFLDIGDATIGAMLAWAPEEKRGLLWILRHQYPATSGSEIIRLPQLAHDANYVVRLLNPEDCSFVQQRSHFLSGNAAQVSGDVLRNVGFRMPFLQADHCAVFELFADERDQPSTGHTQPNGSSARPY